MFAPTKPKFSFKTINSDVSSDVGNKYLWHNLHCEEHLKIGTCARGVLF